MKNRKVFVSSEKYVYLCIGNKEKARIMKKMTFKFMACFVMMMGTTSLQAQQLYENIIKIEQKGLKSFVYDEDGVPKYVGDELRAGQIAAFVVFNADNEEEVELIAPANKRFEVSLTDPYGRIPAHYVDTTVIKKLFMELKYTDFYIQQHTEVFIIQRGGQYVYRNDIPGMDYFYEQTYEVKDDPSVRVTFHDVKAGEDIQVKATYNTGYPYDASQFSDGKQAIIRIFRLGKDNEGNATETEMAMAQKPLQLYRPDQPLVAAIDYLQLNLFEAEPGEYRVKMSSDWMQDGANRDDILIVVSDTLHASARLAKSTYEAGKDNGLKVHVKMKYGFPYIQAQEPDQLPTVRINTIVFANREVDGQQKTDTLLNMTTPIAEAALAEKALDWEDDIITPLLESQEAAPLATTTMQATVNIVFNGKQQFTETIPFTYVPASATAVKRLEGDDATFNTDVSYDLQGRIVPDNDNISKGIYLKNGKKIIR